MSEDAQGNGLDPQSEVLVSPTPKDVEHFWGFARDHVGWATLEGIFGQQQASTMVPPWMHLAEAPAEADKLLNTLTSEGHLEVTTPFPNDAFEVGDLPKRGDLVVLSDARGRPTALAATLKVTETAGHTATGETTKLVTETLACLYPRQE